jgi:hypothetical protein
MEAVIQRSTDASELMQGRVVAAIEREDGAAACHIKDGGRILVSTTLGTLIRPGDKIDHPLVADSESGGN